MRLFLVVNYYRLALRSKLLQASFRRPARPWAGGIDRDSEAPVGGWEKDLKGGISRELMSCNALTFILFLENYCIEARTIED